MSLAAGSLNRRIMIQGRSGAKDGAGQLLDDWIDVGPLWADIAHETGIGAIRASSQSNVPVSIARYSFLVRFSAARARGVDAGMRILYDGEVFDIIGLTRDLKRRDRAFIICEQGGNNG
ncbi:phage head closure protein [Xanthomonas translucens pv. translucens]|uniref:phage head closure protein n=1 Tax=Xanthomonas campestris pv. translucens TaxID=343 RepID=UPI003F6F3B58